jgi:hypothetical protein
MNLPEYLKQHLYEVSAQTGIKVRALRTYQYGERYPRVEQAWKIKDATGLPMEAIYFRPPAE